MAVHSRFKSHRVKCDSALEQVFVRISCASQGTIIVGGVYIPPRSEVSKYSEHCTSLERILGSRVADTVILFGDYNLPDAAWWNDEMGVCVNCPQSSPATTVAESFAYLGLFQQNCVPNSRGVFLDLLFSNCGSVKTEHAYDLLWRNSIHHSACSFSLPVLLPVSPLQYTYWQHNFGRGDYESVNDALALVDWDSLFYNCDVDVAVNKFYDILYTVVDDFISKKKYFSSNFPFSRLRSRCRLLHEQCYAKYISDTEENIKSDPRKSGNMSMTVDLPVSCLGECSWMIQLLLMAFP